MAWSLWSACDESGLQMRSRVCDAQGTAPCVGNGTQRRDCNEIPGESVWENTEQGEAGRYWGGHAGGCVASPMVTVGLFS